MRTNRHFWRHYVEMVVAMVAGMMVLEPLRMVAVGALGWSAWLDQLEPTALAMATEMAIGMAAWMRYRRHQWRPIVEMSGAMYGPFLVLFVPYWIGILNADGVMVAGHVLMLPAMAVTMLRRPREYGRRHAASAHADATGDQLVSQ